MRESVQSARSRNLITFDEILGRANRFRARQAIQWQADVSVLLTGETPAPARNIRRAIHAASRRKDEIFMAITRRIPETC